MVVCLCQGVSDKTVRRAIEHGARSRREVTQSCNAGGVCGGCHRTIAEMIRECGKRPEDCAIAARQTGAMGDLAASAA